MTKKNILITGAAGFIGSHVARLFVNKYPDYNIFNLDLLTYAGNLENVKDIEAAANYRFIKGDICDLETLRYVFKEYDITHVIHLAAESHVDRSIENPFVFIETNVMGTANILQAAREYWNNDFDGHLFYHVSTAVSYTHLRAHET